MPKVFTSDKQKIGEEGENVAAKFLMKQGFKIIERNYTRKWGELDIVAEKDTKIYFIEVKSVTYVTQQNVSRDTFDDYRPEDNMHPWKLKRLSRAIQTYILQKKLDDRDWQFDLLVVSLDMEKRTGQVRVVSDIIL
jgi:putative endonuclease